MNLVSLRQFFFFLDLFRALLGGVDLSCVQIEECALFLVCGCVNVVCVVSSCLFGVFRVCVHPSHVTIFKFQELTFESCLFSLWLMVSVHARDPLHVSNMGVSSCSFISAVGELSCFFCFFVIHKQDSVKTETTLSEAFASNLTENKCARLMEIHEEPNIKTHGVRPHSQEWSRQTRVDNRRFSETHSSSVELKARAELDPKCTKQGSDEDIVPHHHVPRQRQLKAKDIEHVDQEKCELRGHTQGQDKTGRKRRKPPPGGNGQVGSH